MSCEDGNSEVNDSSQTQALVEALDRALPQTQCRQCSYADCRSYAAAIAQSGESIDRCPPGGESTRAILAVLTGVKPETLVPLHPPVQHRIAVVEEPECIGCVKCIKACPVDAIVGAAGMMHSVVAEWCTGCELCMPVCPTDCIAMRDVDTADAVSAASALKRYRQRSARLAQSGDDDVTRGYVALETLTPDNLERDIAAALKRRRS